MRKPTSKLSREKNPTVTVGIPVYNEEQNILHLLRCLLKQTTTSMELREIIVISDGSSDTTEKIVSEFAKKHQIVTLLADHKRKGKSVRLNELYKRNTSDILFLCDGDSLFANDDALALVIHEFTDPDVVLVSTNKTPVAPENKVERFIFWWDELFSMVMGRYNNGQNIHNITSSGYAVRKDFIKDITHPKHIITEGQFLYFRAMEQRKKVRFVRDAVLLTRLPGTIHEYQSLFNRTKNQKKYLVDYFGAWILPYYLIPKAYKWKQLLRFSIMHPVKSFLTISFHLLLFHLPSKEDPEIQKGFWEVIASSKRAISVQ